MNYLRKIFHGTYPLPLPPTIATTFPAGAVNDTLLKTVVLGRAGYSNEMSLNSTSPRRLGRVRPAEDVSE